LDTWELFDVEAGATVASGAMSEARVGHRSTLLPDGRVLLSGGRGATETASTDLFDPAVDQLSPGPPLLAARADHAASLLPDGAILIVGGEAGGSPLATSERLDAGAGAWIAAASLPAARRAPTVTALATGVLLVAGGGPSPSTERWTFDPATGAFDEVAIGGARAGHAAVRLNDGRVALIGGLDGGGETGAVEVVSPAGDTRLQPTVTAPAVLGAPGEALTITGAMVDLIEANEISSSTAPVLRLVGTDGRQVTVATSSFSTTEATATVPAAAAGRYQLFAVTRGAAGGRVVEVLAPPVFPAGIIDVTVTPGVLPADGASTAAVTAGPVRNNDASLVDDGTLVTIESPLGTLVATDADPATPGVQLSTVGASVSFSVVAGVDAGSSAVSIRSVLGDAIGAGELTITPLPADHVSLSAAVATETAGVGIPVSLQAVDTLGAVVESVVGICVDVAGAQATATVAPIAVVAASSPTPSRVCGLTDALGAASVSVVDPTAQQVTVSVESVGLPGSGTPDESVSVEFVAGAADSVGLTPADGVAEACGAEVVAVQVTDALGNRVDQQAELTLSVSGGAEVTSTTLSGATVPSAAVTGTTDAAGAASITVSLAGAGDVAVGWSSATLTGDPAEDEVSLSFVTGVADPSTSVVAADTTDVVAGVQGAQITITPRDACGVDIGSGHTVLLSADYGNTTFVADEGDGTYTSRFTAERGECPGPDAQVTATVDGVPLSSALNFSVTCPPAPPIIDRDANPAAGVGQPYIYDADGRVSATGDDPITFSVAQAPEGFAVDATTGEVSWIPDEEGPVIIAISATNNVATDTYSFQVTVVDAEGRPPPTAALTVTPDSGATPLVVQVDASESAASNGLALVSRLIDFGDGTPPVDADSVEHTYGLAGGYVVRLTVTDSLGATASASAVVVAGLIDTVGPSARIVATETRGSGIVESTLSCDCASGTVPIESFAWDFGDGTTSDDETVTHAWGPGAHEVRLTVTDAAGLSATDRVVIEVADGDNFPPGLVISASPTFGPVPLDVVLRAEVADADGDAVSVEWELPDEVVEGQDASLRLEAPGVVTVTARATDARGLTATATLEVTALDDAGAAPPVIVSSPTLEAVVGEPWRYDDDGTAVARSAGAVTWSLGKRVADELVGAPAGMRVNAQTGQLTWTPSEDQAGAVDVTLIAQNTAGFGEQSFVVEVEGGAAPSCGCRSTGGGGEAAGLFLFAALLLRRRKHLDGAARRAG
jgi:MYXO-CTERM domain-containing protein